MSTQHKCRLGYVYTIETLPEVCPCGVMLFGSWARVNERIADAAKVRSEQLKAERIESNPRGEAVP